MSEAAHAPILIVEDNADTREVLKRVLAIQGYGVVTARDGLDALAYLGTGRLPAAIILDIAMPGMDGITFSGKLRANAAWSHIPVIVYTALPLKQVPVADAVFRKGTDDPRHLFELLDQVTRQH